MTQATGPTDHEVILILGGARSGKSDYAQSLAARLGRRVLYVATATIGDEEMAQRVAHHRASRPAEWGTCEAPMDLHAALLPVSGYDVMLIDCLTLWTTNVLLQDEEHAAAAEARLVADLEAVLALCTEKNMSLIVVSNEVGLGVVPPYPLGRTYRDLLGRANQHLARRADRVLFLVAGLPIDIKALAQQLPWPYAP